MPMHDIIDNQNEKLVDHLNTIFVNSDAAKFAVGYFFLSGFESFKEHLKDISEIKLLIGNITNRKTIEELTLGYHQYEIVQQTIDEFVYASASKSKKLADDTGYHIKDALSYVEQSDLNEELIITLADLIKQGRVKVRVFIRGVLHSKAYIFDYKPGAYEKGIAVVGSSNLTLAGITSNTELNVVVHGNENHRELTKWFEELWKDAEDFDRSLMVALNSSWALNRVMPYDIYMKTLVRLVEKRLKEERETQIVWQKDYPVLTKFQKVAVKQAIRMIKANNGVFIADVVGLGKTYIGAALLKHFQETEGLRPLIICPPSLEEMWDQFCETYRIDARILSSGLLSQGDIDLFDDFRYRNRDIVLIDESHHYRYSDTIKYRRLQPFLSTRKSILMTATPRNNRAMDIYYQMKLFIDENYHDLSIDTTTLKEFFREIEKGNRDLRSVLGQVLIRRTRKHVLKYYSESDEAGRQFIRVGGNKNYFPERELETITYCIDDTYSGLYDGIQSRLESLTYAKYGLYNYVKLEHKEEEPYRQLHQIGKNLKGLMRSLLFKRFESSVYAFRETVNRLVQLHDFFLKALDNNFVAAGDDISRLIYDSDREEETHLIHEIEELSRPYDYKAFLIESLKEDVQKDLIILREIFDLVKNIQPNQDDKFQTLARLMKKIDSRSKILIFSQFSDTTDYLYESLKNEFQNIRKIDGSTKNLHSIVRRFAPQSNNYVLQRGENEIRILITTDVLSEGLNLQDCDIVVNYDLHWNPVRLIQRMGRIDRIGSISDRVQALNFLPEKKLEEKLGLTEKLRERIREIHQTIGEDAEILERDEELNEDAMYAIYAGDESILEDELEEELSMSGIEEIVRNLMENDPEYFNFICNLPDGVRSAMHCDKFNDNRYLMIESNDMNFLLLTDRNGEVITRDTSQILEFIRCERGTMRQPLPRNYNTSIVKLKKKFDREFHQIISAQKRRGNLPKTVKEYILRELQLLYKEYTSEEIRENIEIFTSLLGKNLPENAVKEIKGLKNQKCNGEDILKKLEIIYGKYGLSNYLEEKHDDKKTIRHLMKIVCSEALL